MDKNLNTHELQTYTARLESQRDLLETELTYLNGLLIDVGFPEGIKTLRSTAEDLLSGWSSISQERFLKED